MSTVRKRTWKTKTGLQTGWQVNYVDQQGNRQRKLFKSKKEADSFETTVRHEVQQGTHVAESSTVTVAEAGDLWLGRVKARGAERATLLQYTQHLDLHIKPLIGGTKLTKLGAPAVANFEDRLREKGVSPSMVNKVMVSLSSIVSHAQRHGLCSQNAVKLRERTSSGRDKAPLRVGTDIPTPDEIRALIAALGDVQQGRWRPLLLTAIFTGMRASELRGLCWADVDLEARCIHVTRRADRFGEFGPPKSKAGHRTIPLTPIVVNTLREWKLIYPRPLTGEVDEDGKRLREEAKDSHLVFPNGSGNVENLGNILKRGFMPAQVKAGVSLPKLDSDGKPVLDKKGKPVITAKYTGFHSLRHFYASWLINRPEQGGLGLNPKIVQDRLGHSSVTMTMDVYGHLFPRGDDAEELANAERALLGA
ncbi:tyrosine-type recombinase/integrase [Nitratireductor luteus]|uniref:tyrosine-type recombinase/integrase n=1 Tax=Nitratireductor luteus TaxID=2976980 RepID=UPI00223F8B4A|nr:tyrosine-type recombinase/integrase [Nitratireductor luteus]